MTKFNHPPRVTQPVMPAETLGARRIWAYRTKQSAVDGINSSMSSCITQEERNEVMKVVLKNSEAENAVLASGYIKKDSKVQIALRGLEQRNKMISHATASAKSGRITDDKSAFINSALMSSTSTPTADTAIAKVKMIDEIRHMGGMSRTSAYRRLGYARENRKRLRSDAEDGEWSGKKKRKIFRRLDDDALEKLHT